MIVLLSTTHIPLPLALPPALAAWDLAFWVGAAFTVVGLLFTVWARQRRGSNWSRSVTLKHCHELITTGPYTLVRHPDLHRHSDRVFGTAIALSQVRGVMGFVLIFLVFWAKLRMEEEWMRSQFGETYATYTHQAAALAAKAVPFLIAI